jgi:hypothetical protein
MFVSSTFRDMQGEREILRREVFPVVRRACEERGIGFFEIDLRWGVTREEAESGKVLSICLEEIDRCRPFVLGLIGARYGWVDPMAEAVLAQQERFAPLVPYAACSVTELELRYSLLNRPADSPEPMHLLYRRPAPMAKPAAHAHESAAPFGRLIDDLQIAGIVVRDTPDHLAQFSEIVRRELLELIEKHIPKRVETAEERSRRESRATAALLAHQHVGRAAEDRLIDLVRGRAERIVVIGPAGCGKSMVAAALVRWTDAAFDAEVVAALRPAGWNNWAEAMNAVVAQLKRTSASEWDAEPVTSDPRERFRAALAAAAERRRLIVVIDGVSDENLSPSETPAWWPEAVANATIIVTLRADTSARGLLRRRRWQVVEVQPSLTIVEASKLAERFFSPLGRRLDATQLQALIERPRSPLELALTLEELRCVGQFEQLDTEVARLASLRNVTELLDAAMDRLRIEHGPPVEAMLSALALAPDGLPEAVLQMVAGKPDVPLAPLRFALLRQALNGIAVVGGGRLVLRSALFGAHILRRLHPQGIEAARSAIVDRLRADLSTPGAAEEMLRQLTILERWQDLADTLVNRVAFDAMARRARQQLRAYWALLRTVRPDCQTSVYMQWAGPEPSLRVAEAAALAEDLGDLTTAERLAEAAREPARCDAPIAFALATSVLAAIAEAQGDFERAWTLLAAMQSDKIRAAVPQATAAAAVRRARIALVRSGAAAARLELDAAKADVARIGDERLRAVLVEMATAIAFNANDLRAAEAGCAELIALGDRLGDLAVVAAGMAGRAKLERQRGKLRRAESTVAQAQRFAETAGDDRILQDVLGVASRIAIEIGNCDKASSLIDQRRALTQRIRDVIGELEADVDRARLYALMNDFDEASLVVANVKLRARRCGLAVIASNLDKELGMVAAHHPHPGS